MPSPPGSARDLWFHFGVLILFLYIWSLRVFVAKSQDILSFMILQEEDLSGRVEAEAQWCQSLQSSLSQRLTTP